MRCAVPSVSYVLRNLELLLVGELLRFLVVCFYLRPDHCAVGIDILSLHTGDWLRIATSTR
jgi:hypothetical protein